jgi:hypothetical protein
MESEQPELTLFDLPLHVQNKVYEYVFMDEVLNKKSRYVDSESLETGSYTIYRRDPFSPVRSQSKDANQTWDLVPDNYRPRGVNIYLPAIFSISANRKSLIMYSEDFFSPLCLLRKTEGESCGFYRVLSVNWPLGLPKDSIFPCKLNLFQIITKGYSLYEGWRVVKPYTKIAVSNDSMFIALANHHELFRYDIDTETLHAVASKDILINKKLLEDRQTFIQQIRSLDFDITGHFLGVSFQNEKKEIVDVLVDPVRPLDINVLRCYLYKRAVCKKAPDATKGKHE